MAGELEKLTILSYTDEKRQGAAADTFALQYNPATFTRSLEIEFDQATGSGNTPGPAKFKRYKSQDYTVDFVVDGTGVSGGDPVDVAATVKTFLHIAGEMDGDIHRPRFLKLVWGENLVLLCVLKSVSINYTLFRPDGSPLRAKLSAVFSESVDEQLRTATEGKNSPDLTRTRILQRGETLPNIAFAQYGDPAEYARIARFNDLDHFRALVPGQAVQLPPANLLPSPPAADV